MITTPVLTMMIVITMMMMMMMMVVVTNDVHACVVTHDDFVSPEKSKMLLHCTE